MKRTPAGADVTGNYQVVQLTTCLSEIAVELLFFLGCVR